MGQFVSCMREASRLLLAMAAVSIALPATDAAHAASLTETALTSSVNPSQYGQQVTFTANVTGRGGGKVAGQVTFEVDGASPASAPVNPYGFGGAFAGTSGQGCTVMATGGVKCWGLNNKGQLGDGTTTNSATPVDVVGLANAVAVAISREHTCALIQGGGVKCWGSNGSGQLGDGTTTDSLTPVDVVGLNNAVTLGVGGASNCVLTTAEQVRCWGNNSLGQLGIGSTVNASVPISPIISSPVAGIGVGPGHSCAVLKTGGVFCWGNNQSGEVGEGSPHAFVITPVPVPGLTGITAVSSGESHTCVLTEAGGVKCWGMNQYGELGDGTRIGRPAPVDVVGLTGVTQLVAMISASCALGSGTVKCWGRWGFADTTTPADPAGSPPEIIALSSYGCAVAADASALCWDANRMPVAVPGIASGDLLTFGKASHVFPDPLPVGLRDITADFAADTPAQHDDSSGALQQTVNVASTVSSLGSSFQGSSFGERDTITATVTTVVPNGGVPSGTVTFYEGADAIGSASLDGTGKATINRTLTPGVHFFSAVYAGDGNYAGSNAPTIRWTVFEAQTRTFIDSIAPGSPVVGSPVTFNVSVGVSPPGGGIPTGVIALDFGDGNTANVTLSGGAGSATHAYSALGTFSVSAMYQGDPNYVSFFLPATASVTVGKAATNTALLVASPSVIGQAVTLTATVSGGNPTGSVVFRNGTALIGTAPLSGGLATITRSNFTGGLHALTATYGGDATHDGSSAAQNLQVNRAATSVSVSTAPNRIDAGQTATFTATVVVDPPGNATPAGTVVFLDHNAPIGSAPVSNGQAQLTISSLAAGDHAIRGQYQGNTDLEPSTSPQMSFRVRGAVVVTAMATPNRVAPGQPVTLDATVERQPPPAATPGGQVTFRDGAKLLGRGALSNGAANFSFSPIKFGKHAVTANYDGNAFFGRGSATAELTVTAAVGPEFRVNKAIAGPQSQPAVSAIRDGFVAAWISKPSAAADFIVFAQRFDAAGAALGDQIQVATAPRNPARPAIAGLSDGGFVVVWQDEGIVAQRYSRTGAKAGAALRIGGSASARTPAVASLPAGGFVVVWSASAIKRILPFTIFGQVYRANGKPVGGEFSVASMNGNDQFVPAIAALGGGGFVVSWQSEDGDGAGLYAQRFTANGEARGDGFRVNATAAAEKSYPALSGLIDGGFVLAWQSDAADGSGLGIHARRYGADGTASGQFRVNTFRADDQWQPAISALNTGGFAVLWSSNGQDGSGRGVFAQLFDSAGAANNVEFQVNTTTANDQWQPAVAAFANGAFVSVWTGQDRSSSGIFGQRFLLPP